jgi:hypothetical protein
MRGPNPYVLVLAVSAVLILQVAFARDNILQAGYEDDQAQSAFVARLDLLVADVLFVTLVFLLVGAVRDYIHAREPRLVRRIGVLTGLFIVHGAFHPPLFMKASYDELGPGNLFPVFVDLVILGGLAAAWLFERRRSHHHPKPQPAPDVK